MLFIISQVLLDFAGCQKLGVKREAKRKLHCSRRNVPRLSSMKVCCAWKKNEKLFRRDVPFLCMRRKEAKLSKKNYVIMTCVKKCYSSTIGWCPPKGSQKCQNTRISAKQGIFMFDLHATLTRIWRICKSTHALKLHFSDIWGICDDDRWQKKNIYKKTRSIIIVRILCHSDKKVCFLMIFCVPEK